MIIAEDDHLQVLFHQGSSDFLLITFSELSMVADGVNFWCKAAVTKESISCLGFVAKSRNWFPSGSMQTLIDACRDILARYGQRITYGFSMGGHAALRHAQALGATHAIALSPQSTLDPQKLGARDSWTEYYNPELHAGMEITAEHFASTRAYIFFDPFEAMDVVHVERVVATGGHPILVRTPHLLHLTIDLFTGSKIIAGLIDLVRGDDTAGVFDLARSLRRASVTAHGNRVAALARQAARGTNVSRVQLLGRLIEQMRPEDRARTLDARSAFARIMGDIQGEIALTIERLQSDPRNPHILFQIGRLYHEAGLPLQGIPYGYLCYLHSEGNVHARNSLVALLRSAGFEWEATRLLNGEPN